MPMYDWNGTTATELGKAYDWDGTTTHQLGKGYDWNGTTNSLIYTAEVILSSTLTSTGNNSTSTWNCHDADKLFFDYSVTGTWGYWSGTSFISGTAKNATITIELFLSDGTKVFSKSQNYGDLGCSTNGVATKTLSGSVSDGINLSAYTSSQKTGMYMKATVSESWSNNTNSYSNVSGTLSNGIYE